MMNPTDCESVRGDLADHYYRLLSSPRHGEVDAHLAQCEPCRARADAWHRAVTALGDSTPAFERQENGHDALRRRLAALEPSVRGGAERRRRWERRLAALGAVFFVGGALLYGWAYRAASTDPELLIVGARSALSGSPWSVTVIARRRGDAMPLGGFPLRLSLARVQGDQARDEGLLSANVASNAQGVAVVNTVMPELEPGRYVVRATARDDAGVVAQSWVTLLESLRLRVTSDQARYRAGQTVRLVAGLGRALDGVPSPQAAVSLRVLASDGTVLGRQQGLTSVAGLVEFDFPLSAPCLAGDYEAEVTASGLRAIHRFEVPADATRPERLTMAPVFHGKGQAFFAGEDAVFALRAFLATGEPLGDRAIRVHARLSDRDERLETLLRTDAQGEATWRFPLAAVHDQDPGAETSVSGDDDPRAMARTLWCEAALGEEAPTFPAPAVSARCASPLFGAPFLIELASDESAAFRADNVSSRWMLRVVAAPGEDPRADLSIRFGSTTHTVATDDQGFARFEMPPDAFPKDSEEASISVTAGRGGRELTTRVIGLPPARTRDLLLRLDDAVIDAGSRIRGTVWTRFPHHPAVCELVVDGTPIFARRLAAGSRRRPLEIEAPAAITGDVVLRVWQLVPAAVEGEEALVHDQRGCRLLPRRRLTLNAAFVQEGAVTPPRSLHAGSARLSGAVEESAGIGVAAHVIARLWRDESLTRAFVGERAPWGDAMPGGASVAGADGALAEAWRLAPTTIGVQDVAVLAGSEAMPWAEDRRRNRMWGLQASLLVLSVGIVGALGLLFHVVTRWLGLAWRSRVLLASLITAGLVIPGASLWSAATEPPRPPFDTPRAGAPAFHAREIRVMPATPPPGSLRASADTNREPGGPRRLAYGRESLAGASEAIGDETLMLAGRLITGDRGRFHWDFPYPADGDPARLSVAALDGAGRSGTWDRELALGAPLLLSLRSTDTATVGDRITARATVRNPTATEHRVTLRAFQPPWLALESPSTETFPLAAGAVRDWEWRFRVTSAAPLAVLGVDARCAHEELAALAERPITLEELAPGEHRRFGGHLDDRGVLAWTAEASLTDPPGLATGALGHSRRLRKLALMASVEAELADFILDAHETPLGPVEPLLARLHAELLMARRLRDHGFPEPCSRQALSRALTLEWQTLLTYQGADGGVARFPGEPGDALASAWAARLALQATAFAAIDTERAQRWRRFAFDRQSPDGGFSRGNPAQAPFDPDYSAAVLAAFGEDGLDRDAFSRIVDRVALSVGETESTTLARLLPSLPDEIRRSALRELRRRVIFEGDRRFISARRPGSSPVDAGDERFIATALAARAWGAEGDEGFLHDAWRWLCDARTSGARGALAQEAWVTLLEHSADRLPYLGSVCTLQISQNGGPPQALDLDPTRLIGPMRAVIAPTLRTRRAGFAALLSAITRPWPSAMPPDDWQALHIERFGGAGAISWRLDETRVGDEERTDPRDLSLAARFDALSPGRLSHLVVTLQAPAEHGIDLPRFDLPLPPGLLPAPTARAELNAAPGVRAFTFEDDVLTLWGTDLRAGERLAFSIPVRPWADFQGHAPRARVQAFTNGGEFRRVSAPLPLSFTRR